MGQNAGGYWLVAQETLDRLGTADDLESRLRPRSAEGLIVTAARPGDPLYELGLRPGDLIVSINGVRPATTSALRQAGNRSPHDHAALGMEIERKGQIDLVYYQLED